MIRRLRVAHSAEQPRARLLKSVDGGAVDGSRRGHAFGAARCGQTADATIVAIAAAGDHLVTGDPGDVTRSWLRRGVRLLWWRADRKYVGCRLGKAPGRPEAPRACPVGLGR